MKKKILIIAAIVVCVVAVALFFVFFTPKLTFKRLIQKGFEPETAPTLGALVSTDLKGSISSNTGELVVLVNTNQSNGLRTTTIYNVATGTTIWSGTESNSQSGNGYVEVAYTVGVTDVYLDGETITLAYITKTTTTVRDSKSTVEYGVTVLTENGSKIADLNNVDKTVLRNTSWQTADLICVDNEVYRLSKEGDVDFLFTWSELREAPGSLKKAGEYYVSTEGNAVYVYDDTLTMTASYRVPVYDIYYVPENDYLSDEPNFHVLSNGNVLIQYVVRQDEQTNKYTFMLNDVKYDLHTVLLRAKNGKTKELNLDYIIAYVRNGNDITDAGLNEKIDNLAVGLAIEDKRINMDEGSAELLSLTNRGGIKGVVKSPTQNVNLAWGIYAVAKNRWAVYTNDGRTLILNEKGKEIGEIPNSAYENDSGFVVNKAVYDWDLNQEIDLKTQDATSVIVMNNSVIFHTKDGSVKLYCNGSTQTLVSGSDIDKGYRAFTKLSQGAYMITDNTGSNPRYEVYNENGELLGTIYDSVSTPSVACETVDGMLLLVAQKTDSTEKAYYRVK